MRMPLPLRFIGYAALFAATLEIAARIHDHVIEDAPLLGPYSINTLFRPSPHGREGVPGAHYAKWRMNSLGYRSPELRGDRVNIVAFGASETFGLYESPDREYPRVVEARLEQLRPQVYSVVNIAMPGIRIGRVGYLERAVEQTQAGHIVVYPSLANYIDTTEPFCQQESRPAASPSGPAELIRLTGKLDQQAKILIPASIQDSIRALLIWSATRNEMPLSRVPEATLNAFAEDLRCVVSVARKHNATPILVTHATYFGDRVAPEDAAMMLAWRRFYPQLREEGFLDLERRANDAIRTVAAESQVPLVDAAIAMPKGPTYFADFVHFTDKGAAVMAGLIADAILNEPSRLHPLPTP